MKESTQVDKSRWRLGIAAALTLLVSLSLSPGCGSAGNEPVVPQTGTPTRDPQAIRASTKSPWRILCIMSYHSPWEWTDDQLRGFKEAFKGLNVEYQVFQMDTKRNSSEQWREDMGFKARKLIDSWKPDLVYTMDDNAQKYVARYYLNRETPFVFSGVNDDPKAYGLVGTSNHAGVLEHEHFVETVKLLREIVPKVSRIAVIVDEDPTWIGVVQRMKEKAAASLPDCEFVSWDVINTFEGYKEKVVGYQNTVDALALLGIHGFKNGRGINVPWKDVVRWTTENSHLPDFSFWKDRIPYGTLCAVYVSGYDQGRAAGRIAYGILVEGRSPASYPMEPTIKGEPIISLARAKKLGIRVDSGLLLTATIVTEFQWEQ
jgi:ABC-type uncharacterized transport system substrate-binding protein